MSLAMSTSRASATRSGCKAAAVPARTAAVTSSRSAQLVRPCALPASGAFAGVQVVASSARPSARRVACAVRVQAAHKGPDNGGKKTVIITGELER